MKKLSIFGMLALLILGLASTALAAEVKVSGKWQIEANSHYNWDFLGKGAQNGEDNTLTIEQRMRTAFTFVANENLKAVLDTQIGTNTWGNGLYQIGAGRSASTTAGGNAAGGGNIMLRKGYIDFKWPGTKVNFLVGYQTVNLPAAFGGGSAILDDQLAAAIVSAPIADGITLLAGYARPYDAQSAGSGTTAGLTGHGTSTDVVFAALPMSFKGVTVAPFAAYMNSGYNTAGLGAGPTSLAGFAGPNSSNNEGLRGYWGGAALTVTALDNFKFMADVNYGKVTYNNQGTNAADGGRSGWLLDAAVDYTGLKNMTPSAFVVYSTGEGGNSTQKDSSGRMPVIANPQTWTAGSFFFGDRDFITGFGAQAGYIRNCIGFWAAGVSLKDMTFVDKLKHTATVMYVKGTNDADYLMETGSNLRAATYGGFLTDKDSLWEVDFNSKYMIYDELSVYLNLGYINANFDKDVWGASSATNAADIAQYGSKDAYKVALGLTYAF